MKQSTASASESPGRCQGNRQAAPAPAELSNGGRPGGGTARWTGGGAGTIVLSCSGGGGGGG
eukprot:13837341-Alexandrium_andersonii.AAC.1